MDKLSNLWNRISMDVDGREEFLAKYQDYKESTIKAVSFDNYMPLRLLLYYTLVVIINFILNVL